MHRLATRRRGGSLLGVREDKKRQTRVRLERAALDLFARDGYDHTTVAQIAARAGVSARTAFRYFPAKVDLLFGDAETDLATLRVRLARQDRSLPAIEAVRGALAEFSEHMDRAVTAERSRLVASSPTLTARALEVREQWVEAVAEEFAARRGARSVDERDRLAGLLVVAVLVSGVRQWSQRNGAAGGLRAAVDRAASWAAEILEP